MLPRHSPSIQSNVWLWSDVRREWFLSPHAVFQTSSLVPYCVPKSYCVPESHTGSEKNLAQTPQSKQPADWPSFFLPRIRQAWGCLHLGGSSRLIMTYHLSCYFQLQRCLGMWYGSSWSRHLGEAELNCIIQLTPLNALLCMAPVRAEFTMPQCKDFKTAFMQ